MMMQRTNTVSGRSFYLAVSGIAFFLAIATFKGFAGFKNTKPLGLWIIYILWPLACTVIYVVS
jgi:hypothetical protein